jgi:hypothetical protein
MFFVVFLLLLLLFNLLMISFFNSPLHLYLQLDLPVAEDKFAAAVCSLEVN